MSRVGRKPIPIPEGVEVTIEGSRITVKGPLGTLSRELESKVEVVRDDGQLVVQRRGETKAHKAMHGLFRTLVANMIEGVTKGFSKELLIVGTGYKARKQGNRLVLDVGYSRPVIMEPPEGIEVDVPESQKIVVKGIDKERVGNFAASVRRVRPPDSYKGKGIRYADEEVSLKPGKAAKVGGR